jgi:REP element-mobilizing transposase RayT
VGFVAHVPRPRHHEDHPVHVTARAVARSPSLRSQRIFAAIRAVLARSSEKGFRLLHFSVQGNHMHLIVEADDGVALARGVQRLLSRVAQMINAIARRSGRLWRDRYHREDLTTPRQVRNAYVYVLFNDRRHALHRAYFTEPELATFDSRSSAAWFSGWAPRAGPDDEDVASAGPPIVAKAESWLANVGWKKAKQGLLRIGELPRGRGELC